MSVITLGFKTRGEDNRDKCADNPSGRLPHPDHRCPHNHHPPSFMPDALPAATLLIYPGLGQAPNMLHCIPRGLAAKDYRL